MENNYNAAITKDVGIHVGVMVYAVLNLYTMH